MEKQNDKHQNSRYTYFAPIEIIVMYLREGKEKGRKEERRKGNEERKRRKERKKE